jgi:hypothetical protein
MSSWSHIVNPNRYPRILLPEITGSARPPDAILHSCEFAVNHSPPRSNSEHRERYNNDVYSSTPSTPYEHSMIRNSPNVPSMNSMLQGWGNTSEADPFPVLSNVYTSPATPTPRVPILDDPDFFSRIPRSSRTAHACDKCRVRKAKVFLQYFS